MDGATLTLCRPEPGRPWGAAELRAVEPCLERLDARERVRWALAYLPGPAILSSSFGAQAAVMLHLVTREAPDIPVVLIDTGYLFPETYAFVEALRERLNLNLQVFSAEMTPAFQEARFGRLWEQGVEGIERYNQINKVEPMARALQALQAGTWFSGIRRSQSSTRRDAPVATPHGTVAKVHPLIDWGDRDIHRYLQRHALPYHPLWERGYLSIGDHHTSRPLGPEERPEDTRFHGLVRECGLHQPERFVD